ncbi:MAG: cation:proton antiporter [Legionellaceae bacterium]|nr:cation:proton antiporter [Legionellaceae bacterium]
MSNGDLVAHLLIQLMAILVTCKVAGFIGRRLFAQTEVVCEMIAGVVLGPSLLGYFAPNVQQWLFPIHHYVLANGQTLPNSSMSIIHVFGQLGLIFFMFVVGLEFDAKFVRNRARGVGAIVFGSTLIPILVGCAVSYVLVNKADLFLPSISIETAMCYLGVCFAITAFPMLARILEERGLTQTSVGTLSLVAGSICDAISWCLLSLLLAIVKADQSIATYAVVGGAIYIVAMVFPVKKIAVIIFTKYATKERADAFFIGTIIYLLFSAWLTNQLGIYPIFGAFVAGAVLPRAPMIDIIRQRIQPLTTYVLLPLFFVYSGLNTEIQLINNSELWSILGLIIVAAIVGKLVACSVSAKVSGESWRDALTIGALMNSRGLMELIVLNIGLEYHIITPVMFSILTIMAIVTTLMTTPLLNLIYAKRTSSLSIAESKASQ